VGGSRAAPLVLSSTNPWLVDQHKSHPLLPNTEQAEVEAELDALVKLPKTAEVRARAAELRSELRQYGGSGQRPWWRPW
jgi:hypothetical protein